jgi:hypothetical protein
VLGRPLVEEVVNGYGNDGEVGCEGMPGEVEEAWLTAGGVPIQLGGNQSV